MGVYIYWGGAKGYGKGSGMRDYFRLMVLDVLFHPVQECFAIERVDKILILGETGIFPGPSA